MGRAGQGGQAEDVGPGRQGGLHIPVHSPRDVLHVVSAVLAHPDGIPVYTIIVASTRFYYDRTV